MIKGFQPVFDSNSKILILGSFPSVISRKNQFYYGNPHNRFWRVLSQSFNEKIDEDTTVKKLFLLSHNIALWDIVYECEIKGSSDTDIKNIVIADLSKIINASHIEKIICNGRKAYELTVKYYSNLNIPIIYLHSTSPANTRFNINIWLEVFHNL